MSAPSIRFVLLSPSHPGNIGAVARAMKNMGLANLWLVNPREFPHTEADARASGADDLLRSARVVASLPEALAGCGFVIATTARVRDQNFRVLPLRAAAERMVAESRTAPVAVLFGTERSGLSNEELENAHALLRIPANPEYESLNLAMAAQLVSYEIMMARGAPAVPPTPGAVPMASAESMERLFAHWQAVLDETDFRDRTQSGTNLMGRIRRFLQRAELDVNEANILRGVLTAVQGRRRPAGSEHAAGEGTRDDVVYLDYAASAPVAPQVATAMFRVLQDRPANAASQHAPGRAAAARVTRARSQVARLIGAQPDDVVFTSGATEANNLAILGLARGAARIAAGARAPRHVVTLRIEHKAVLDPCRQLEAEGFKVTLLVPGTDGRLAPDALAAALLAETVLVSVQHANNETGVIQDIAALAAVCRKRGVPLHVDAAQTVGKLPVDVEQLGIDALSLSAHKFGGPQGIGALYVRPQRRALLQPLQFGGAQERGLRAGTLPVALIVGLGVACEMAISARAADAGRVAALRAQLWKGLQDLPGASVNGDAAHSLPNILNVSFAGVEGESLFTGLTELALSTGAACNSASGEPSYVLRALGRSTQLAQSSLRFSLGRYSTQRDVERAIAAVRREVLRLGALSPAAPWSQQGRAPLTDGWPAHETLTGSAGRESLGTQVCFALRVQGERVIDARWLAYGAPAVLAACEWLVRELPGRTCDALVPGAPAEWLRRLEAPADRLGSLLIVEDALRNCVADQAPAARVADA